jgi:hypothetical protein
MSHGLGYQYRQTMPAWRGGSVYALNSFTIHRVTP